MTLPCGGRSDSTRLSGISWTTAPKPANERADSPARAPKPAGRAYIHVGGEGVSSLWLNGKPLDMRGLNDAGKECLLGYHAGKLRIEVNLNAGANTLVMETTGFFFVSVTDQRVWEEDYCRNYQ